MDTEKLDNQDRYTILAALRLWQAREEMYTGGRSEALLDVATNGGEVEALDDSGIDDLCARLDPPAPKTTARDMPVCSKCGSIDVRFDAYAEWDVEAQDYSLVTTFDNSDCEVCGGECSVNWVNADVYVEPDYTPVRDCAVCTGTVEDHAADCPSKAAEAALAEVHQ